MLLHCAHCLSTILKTLKKKQQITAIFRGKETTAYLVNKSGSVCVNLSQKVTLISNFKRSKYVKTFAIFKFLIEMVASLFLDDNCTVPKNCSVLWAVPSLVM